MTKPKRYKRYSAELKHEAIRRANAEGILIVFTLKSDIGLAGKNILGHVKLLQLLESIYQVRRHHLARISFSYNPQDRRHQTLFLILF